MGKKQRKKAAAAAAAATATAAPTKKAGWEAITLKKKPASKPTTNSVSRTATAIAGRAVANEALRAYSPAHTGGSAATQTAITSVAPKTHRLPNFKGEIRALALAVDPNSPPQPALTLRKVATIYAYAEGGSLTKESCQLMLTELDLFKPPRAYLTRGGFEIVWVKAVGAGARGRLLSLAKFKDTLVPALAQALKPKVCPVAILHCTALHGAR